MPVRESKTTVGIAAQRSKGRRRITMAVGWRASRRGPRAWTHEWARVAPRNRRGPVNPARISRPTCGGSRTSPIFHEVVTPDGLSLSGCLLYPRCGRKSSVKSLRPASSCLPSLLSSFSPSFSLSLTLSFSSSQKKAFCRSGLAVRSNVSRSTVR